MSLLAIVILLLVIAVLVWGGDGLIKLLPGDGRLKQAARIVLIVALAIWCLSMIASFLGVPMPWDLEVRRR